MALSLLAGLMAAFHVIVFNQPDGQTAQVRFLLSGLRFNSFQQSLEISFPGSLRPRTRIGDLVTPASSEGDLSFQEFKLSSEENSIILSKGDFRVGENATHTYAFTAEVDTELLCHPPLWPMFFVQAKSGVRKPVRFRPRSVSVISSSGQVCHKLEDCCKEIFYLKSQQQHLRERRLLNTTSEGEARRQLQHESTVETYTTATADGEVS